MGVAIGLRDDFDGVALRRLARITRSANQARRFLALAEIYDGASRTAAGRIRAPARFAPCFAQGVLHAALVR